MGFLVLAAFLAAMAYKVFTYNADQLLARQARLIGEALPRVSLSLNRLQAEMLGETDRFANAPELERAYAAKAGFRLSRAAAQALSRRLSDVQTRNPAVTGGAILSTGGRSLWDEGMKAALGALPAGFVSALPLNDAGTCSDLAVRDGTPWTACLHSEGGLWVVLLFAFSGAEAHTPQSLGSLTEMSGGELGFYLARKTPSGSEVFDHDPDHPGRDRIFSLPPEAAVSHALRRPGVASGHDHFGNRVAAMASDKPWLGWNLVGTREIGSRIDNARLIGLIFMLLGSAALAGGFFFASSLMREAEDEAAVSRTALSWNRLMLDKITRALPTGIYIFDLVRGVHTFATPAFERMLGFSEAEIRAAGPGFLLERLHPDDSAVFTEAAGRFGKLQDAEVTSSMYRFQVKCGDYRWFRSSDIVFERDEGGRPRLILGSIADCTEEVVARETLTAALVRARLLTHAVTNAAESIVITDLGGTIQYLNPAGERTSGYTSAEAVGKHTRIFNSGMQNKAFYQTLWGTILRGEVWHGTFVTKRKDGTFFTEDASIAPVKNEAGAVTNFVAVKRDVSRERALENQLAQAQKLEAVGRLAGGVAHDFNNILTSILGYTQLAKDELPEGDPLKEDLAEIEKGAKRASDLTRQLLVFSRKQVIQPRPVDPGAVVRDLKKMLQRIIGENYRLVFASEGAGRLIKADPSQLEQVVLNFVVNSRDAMPGGGDIHVSVMDVRLAEPLRGLEGPIPPGSYAALTVKDSGVGISAQAREHIFEPFFTTKPTGQGTGLGLATVYGIVKDGGAYLTVDSVPGEGTRMSVYWPHSEEGLVPAEISAAKIRGGSESILLVEDEGAVRRLSERLLAFAGYSVTSCPGPEEALAKASDSHTLLLTDVVMPKMSGKELAERLRRDHPSLKVLYTSGYSDEIISKQGMLDPGASLLQKPFSQEELLKAVRGALDS